MEKQIKRTLKEYKKTLEDQRRSLDKNTALFMADDSNSEKDKEYMKSFSNRLTEAISKGDSAGLTSLKDEILNKNKS